MNKDTMMPKSFRTIATGWLKLLVAVLIILGFMFYVGPWIEKTDFYSPVVQGIDRFGINANAYYYTDVDQCGEGGHYIRASLEYPPTGPIGGR